LAHIKQTLGGSGRDRSPPRGGGAGGFGPGGVYRQMPSGPHDLPGMFGSGGFFHGSCNHGGRGRQRGGRNYQSTHKGSVFDRLGGGRACVPLGSVFDRLGKMPGAGSMRHGAARRALVWRPKQLPRERHVDGSSPTDAGASFPARASLNEQRKVDPMEEEAAWTACSALGQSAGSSRSVEPTTTVADTVLVCARALSPQNNSVPHAYSGDTGAPRGTSPGTGLGGQTTAMEHCRVPAASADARVPVLPLGDASVAVSVDLGGQTCCHADQTDLLEVSACIML
jgi:hypothetical protein